MVQWFQRKKFSPIGVDLGSCSVKLVQFDADRTELVGAARWDLGNEPCEPISQEVRCERLTQAVRKIREQHDFRGRQAVVCLTDRELFLQNIRVPKADAAQMRRLVHQEALGRIPFGIAETEVRCLDAADVRQGEAVLREFIVLACHRPVLDLTLRVIERAGLQPVAVDIEPAALLRSCVQQFRRDEDREMRTLVVHIGFSKTTVVIAQGDDVLFIKYLTAGGRNLDEAVARHLNMPAEQATALRRHNGDRRSDQQDPDIARSVSEAVRPVWERLVSEVGLCVRYHSVTFRGKPLARLVLGGGEATAALQEVFASRLHLKCELSDPLRGWPHKLSSGHNGQWDVAAGLALRDVT